MFKKIKSTLKSIRQMTRRIVYRGKNRFCPICQKHSKLFGNAGLDKRADAHCYMCDSLERHRLVWQYFKTQTSLFDVQQHPADFKMLHVAPEEVFEKKLIDILGSKYLSADLYNPDAMIQMDITQIDFPDHSFDVIYCSHVLEHVQNDVQAMTEFFRVLKPNGWAMLLVPIVAELTFEDPSIVDPLERERIFGQKDHVRNYGLDYIDRLRSAQFKVQKIVAQDFLSPREIIQMGITEASGDLYLCSK